MQKPNYENRTGFEIEGLARFVNKLLKEVEDGSKDP